MHPAAGEVYFLKMLLNHIKGPPWFDEFAAGLFIQHLNLLACKALVLLGDDKEWSEAFCKAIATTMSP